MTIRQTVQQTALAVLALLALCAPQALADTSPEGGRGYLEQSFSLGYRLVETENDPGRASEYESHHSSAIASLGVAAGRGGNHFHLDLDVLAQDDYRGEGHADYKGLLRFDLFTSAFVHNLDHIPYDSRPDAVSEVKTVISFEDLNPGDEYQIKRSEYGGKFRGKHPGVPIHLNVGYWRQERSGDQQMRFIQEGTTPGVDPVTAACNQCHLQSKSRPLDQVTQEVTAGIDSHLGPIDLIYEFLVREFRDDEGIPVDQFGAFGNFGLGPRRAGGDFQHDEVPDSKLISSTVKAHTSLSGGVVGAASFTLGQRENHSELSDVQGVKSETDFLKTAGDLTLTPFSALTLNFRYRWLDLDNTNSATLTAAGLPAAGALPLEVRDNPDQTRASYEGEIAWRPVRALTLKGQYRREEIHRGNTGDAFATYVLPTSPDPYWELPEDETIDTARVSFLARPLGRNRLKLNAWYQYRTSDDPAYGTSAETGHEAFAGVTWTPTRRVALTVNARGKKEENSKHRLSRLNGSTTPKTPVYYDLDRSAEDGNLTGSLWLQPVDPLSLTLNYGYLRSRITQDLLFGTHPNSVDPTADFALEDEDVEYAQHVQTASVSLAWQLHGGLRLLAEGRHIRSEAHYDPRFAASGLTFSGFTPPTSVDASDLRRLSQLDIRQNGLTGELAWTPADGWGISARYTYDDYDDRDTGLFEGKAQTYLASLSRNW